MLRHNQAMLSQGRAGPIRLIKSNSQGGFEVEQGVLTFICLVGMLDPIFSLT